MKFLVWQKIMRVFRIVTVLAPAHAPVKPACHRSLGRMALNEIMVGIQQIIANVKPAAVKPQMPRLFENLLLLSLNADFRNNDYTTS